MFFVQNSEGTIVAADKEFLEAAGFKSLLLAAEHFRSENIGPDPEHGLMELNNRTIKFTVRDIHTLWGEGLLFQQESAHPEVEESPSDALEEDRSLPVAVPEAPETEAPSDTASTEAEAEAESRADASDTDDHEEAIPSEPSAAEEGDENEGVLELMDLEEIADLPSETEPPHPEETEKGEEEGLSLSEVATGSALGAGVAAALHSAAEHLSDDDAPSSAETAEEESPLELLDLAEPENDEAPQKEHEAETAEEEPLELFDLAEPKDDTPEASAEKETSLSEEEPLELFTPPASEESPSDTDLPADLSSPDTSPELLDLSEPATVSEPDVEPGSGIDTDTAPSDSDLFAPVPESAGIAYEQNAGLIGISTEEYLAFLSQFVDESFKYEPHLRGRDLREFRSSLASLKDASQLLHLPQLTDQLRLLEGATSDEKETVADDYYALIRRIRDDLETYRNTHKDTADTAPAAAQEIPEPSSGEAPLQEPVGTPDEIAAEAPRPEAATEAAPPETETGGQMTMEEVQDLLHKATPIPFDFSTNVASEELGLPEALVGEFVADFIQQAKENIPLLLSSHQKGDMPTLQSTAHLLKGAASNLRIDPLAKTLEEMQFNEDPEKVPALFDRFLGQLKALDNLIRQHGLN